MAEEPSGTTAVEPSDTTAVETPEEVQDTSRMAQIQAQQRRAITRATLEGIPVLGPLILNLEERLFAVANERALTDVEQETLQLFQQFPKLRTRGNIAGAVASTLPLGAGGLGEMLFGTVPRAAATGAALGAADVAARGGEPEDIAMGAGIGAVGGAGGVVLGRFLTQVGRGIVSAFRVGRSKLAGVIAGASDDLVNQARNLYRQADAVGLKVDSSTFDRMISKIVKAATPSGDLAEEVLRANTPKAAAAIRWLETLKGREPTLSEIDQVRQFLGDVAKSADAGERRLGHLMINALDDTLSNLKQANFVGAELKQGVTALEQARGLWRRGKILESLAGAAERAELANQPLGQALQREARTLLRRQKFVRGLTDAEKKMLRDVARADVDTALSIIGQFRTLTGALPSGAGVGGAAFLFGGADPVTATALGGAVSLGQTAVSSAARGIKSVLARQRLLDATEALRTGIAVPKTLPAGRGVAAAITGATVGGGVTITREREGVAGE